MPGIRELDTTDDIHYDVCDPVRAPGTLDFWDWDRGVLGDVRHGICLGEVDVSAGFDKGVWADFSRSKTSGSAKEVVAEAHPDIKEWRECRDQVDAHGLFVLFLCGNVSSRSAGRKEKTNDRCIRHCDMPKRPENELDSKLVGPGPSCEENLYVRPQNAP